MRVLYVSHTPLIGGAEHCLLDLIAELPGDVIPLAAVPAGPLADELARRGVPVRPLPPTDVGLAASPAEIGRGGLRALAAARAVRSCTRAHRADLVHANSMRAALVAGLATYPGGPPVLAHNHDSLPSSRLRHAVERMATARGSHVLALSRDSAATLSPAVPLSRIHIVGNGVDLHRFDPDRIDRRRARERVLPRDAPTLAVVAQITPWKGQDDAVAALAHVRERVPGAQLLLVGSPKFASAGARYDNEAFERQLHHQVGALGLAGSVHLLGERPDVEHVLRAADVVLMPSWNEPFGRVMLESMAVGTPVVATAHGGPADVIEDGRTGLLVPARDPAALAAAALRLLLDADLRAGVIAAAAGAVRRFDRAAWAARVLEVYREATGSTRRSTTQA